MRIGVVVLSAGSSDDACMKHLLRFARALHPSRTDIWDWRTYGRPSVRDFIELLTMIWKDSE